jgi:hypothetical protein
MWKRPSPAITSGGPRHRNATEQTTSLIKELAIAEKNKNSEQKQLSFVVMGIEPTLGIKHIYFGHQFQNPNSL